MGDLLMRALKIWLEWMWWPLLLLVGGGSLVIGEIALLSWLGFPWGPVILLAFGFAIIFVLAIFKAKDTRNAG